MVTLLKPERKRTKDPMANGEGRKVGRNDDCTCGSGKKYKRCCIAKEKKQRVISTDESCPSCGEGLVIDLTDNPFFQLLNYQTPLRLFLKENDLYLFGICRGRDEQEMISRLEAGTLTVEWVLDLYRRGVTREFTTSLVTRWCDLYPVFEKRREHILQVVDAHYEGKFHLAVTSLFPIIEGILRDVGGVGRKEDFRASLPLEGWDRKLAFEIRDHAAEFNTFINKLFKGDAADDQLHRNPVLHGANVLPGTEHHSLLLLLTLLEIGFFCFYLKELKDVVPSSSGKGT